MATYLLEHGQEEILCNYWGLLNEYDTIEYEGVVMPTDHACALFSDFCTSSRGITYPQLASLAKQAWLSGVHLTPLSAKKLAKLQHKNNEKVSAFLEKYADCGFTKCKPAGKKVTQDKLRELFGEQKRFRGRAPMILPQIASACDYYGISTEDAADKFSIQYVRNILQSGVSKVETALLYVHLSEQQLSNIAGNQYVSQMVSTLIDRSYRKSKEDLLQAALWIADHANSDIRLLEKVYNRAADLQLGEDVSVENVRTQFSNNKALNEVEKIEKAYKKCGFKFKNCVCELKQTTTKTDRYKAEILKGDDPRQVMLGYDTDCCQHLGEAGESAMMHGLLHPKAGFWVVTKLESGKVVAQAESWELNDKTLVFDNIEFANDAEIDQYKEIIGKWVAESAYENVIMGCGYNTLSSDTFEHAGAIIPPVTPYELYVLSYEDDCYARDEICELPSEEEAKRLMDSGEITYYDYVYCDSENVSVYLKKDGQVAEYFGTKQQENILQVQDLPRIGQEQEGVDDDFDLDEDILVTFAEYDEERE